MQVSPFPAIFRSAGSMLSKRNGGQLVILIYHRVLEQFDPLRAATCGLDDFTWQMELLSEYFNVLPLSQAVDLALRGGLPPRAACITFDDGYADNLSVAVPILKRLGLSATFFIATGYLDGGRMWNDSVTEALRAASGPSLDLTAVGLESYPTGTDGQRRAAIIDILSKIKHLPDQQRDEITRHMMDMVGVELPRNLMMSSADVPALIDAGMGVGGHTVTHPILANLEPASARDEILDGKRELERLTGEAITLFAYPNGTPVRDYSADTVAAVRDCGFTAAVTTARGVAGRNSDPYQLPRFTPWDKTPGKFLMRLIGAYANSDPLLC